MIKIAIVEDNDKMMAMASRYVYLSAKATVDSAIEIKIEQFASAEKFLEGLSKKAGYDILLVDIGLPRMSGVDLGKKIREEYPEIYLVFLTSYVEYAIDSYRIGAYQYILKEDMEDRLPQTIEYIVERISRSSEGYRWVGSEWDRSKIVYKEIIYICKSKGAKYTEYITVEKRYKERIPIKQLIKELDNEVFILVDRSNIINLNHIIRLKGDTIYLTEDEHIIVTPARMSKLKERIHTLWQMKNGAYSNGEGKL